MAAALEGFLSPRSDEERIDLANARRLLNTPEHGGGGDFSVYKDERTLGRNETLKSGAGSGMGVFANKGMGSSSSMKSIGSSCS